MSLKKFNFARVYLYNSDILGYFNFYLSDVLSLYICYFFGVPNLQEWQRSNKQRCWNKLSGILFRFAGFSSHEVNTKSLSQKAHILDTMLCSKKGPTLKAAIFRVIIIYRVYIIYQFHRNCKIFERSIQGKWK